MTSINDLALKGYFHSLKDEMNQQAEYAGQRRLLRLLEKAAGMIEEVYEKDFNLLHPDNALDYQEIIGVLNEYGFSYKGKTEILDLAAKFKPAEKALESRPEKLPMKKAGKTHSQSAEHQRRKSG